MPSKMCVKSKSKVNIAEGIDLSYGGLKGKKIKSSMKQVAAPEKEAITSHLIYSQIDPVGDEQKSPLEVDLEIQRSRIMQILDVTIQKIEVAACLPILLNNNAAILRRFLKPVEIDFILDVCSGYDDFQMVPLTAEQLTNVNHYGRIIEEISMVSNKRSTTKKVSTVQADTSSMVDPLMTQVFEMLWANRCVKERHEKILPRIDPVTKNFIACMHSLREATVAKFNVTAAKEREREKELRKAWKANRDAQETIAEIQNYLDKQREDLGVQLQRKHEILESYHIKIQDLIAKFKSDIRNRIQISEQGMMEDTQASEARQAELAVEAKQAQQQYQSLLEQHLAYEKKLRAKRTKVETQLASWVAKYDNDMGDRQAEFEEITKGFEEEKAELQSLQEKFDEQEEEYEVLMAEKEEEELRMLEEMAMQFCRNRSARIIQLAWRAYRERKKARRKGRKGKGKKK